MADILNFDRQYRFSAGQAGGSGFEVGESAQVPIPLHCEFSFQKTDLTSQNTGRVTLWNLNRSQIATLKEKDCAASFRAVYGKNLSLIFSGIISFSATSLDGADRKTEIEIIDNLVQIRDTFVSVSYNGTVNWKTIMDDTAAQMGVAVSYSYNAAFVDIPNGFSYVGNAKDIMDKRCQADALLYAFEKTYLDHVGSDCDGEMSNRATYAFYAIWDAVREASENLDRLEGDERVVDVILAARKNGSTLTR